jgi:type IV pilus assembly protein PilY1
VSSTSVGYSSYFALDITNQNNPVLLWEFSHPDLGYTTGGPAVVRISAQDPVTHNPVMTKNGKWFVVLGSGPTGPIDRDYKQFLGHSDQNLKLFVLDLKTGPASPVTIIDTGISNAFAGSMYNATMDTDVNYQDDVVYIPYVKKTLFGTTWTDGGVGRLVTKQDPNPANWAWSKVMDGIGPVTSAVTKLQNNTTHTLWPFFGTGRYIMSRAASRTTPRASGKYSAKEPCFSISGLNTSCTSVVSGLEDVTDINDVPRIPMLQASRAGISILTETQSRCIVSCRAGNNDPYPPAPV